MFNVLSYRNSGKKISNIILYCVPENCWHTSAPNTRGTMQSCAENGVFIWPFWVFCVGRYNVKRSKHRLWGCAYSFTRCAKQKNRLRWWRRSHEIPNAWGLDMVTRLPCKIITEVRGGRLKVRCGDRDNEEPLADVRRDVTYTYGEKKQHTMTDQTKKDSSLNWQLND